MQGSGDNLNLGIGPWALGIIAFAKNLIKSGFVNKELKGELYAQLLCILARDMVLTEEKSMEPFRMHNLSLPSVSCGPSLAKLQWTASWLMVVHQCKPVRQL